tara:strand:- start:7370 stop:7531 length:162 start_codon:yes stop_codon:yes gene_type:complete
MLPLLLTIAQTSSALLFETEQILCVISIHSTAKTLSIDNIYEGFITRDEFISD